MDTYDDKYICDDDYDSILEMLGQYGVAIVPNVLSADECAAMLSGVWDAIEHITSAMPTPVRRDDATTWRGFGDLFALHSMLIQWYGIGHAQVVWNIRQHPAVLKIFAEFWGVEPRDLIVSFDGLSLHLPPETTRRGWFRNSWLHTDQSYRNNKFSCVQSWITACDITNGDATLAFLEGSHRFHAATAAHFNITSADAWYRLNDVQRDWLIERGCVSKKIRCRAGSLVLWDSRLIHCGQEAMKERATPNIRCVIYLCYSARTAATQKALEKRIQYFETRRMTGHLAHLPKLFTKTPRIYGGGGAPNVTALPAPELDEIGRRLVGY